MYTPAISTKFPATTKQPIATPQPVATQPAVAKPSPLLQTTQPLTQMTSTYKDPRAGILYGAGNSNISDADIKSFIGNAKTSEEVLQAALRYGVSADQVSRAMGGANGYDNQNISKYLNEQGISNEMNQVAQVTAPKSVPLPNPVVAPVVNATPVQLNENTDMVEGRLDNLLSNPNNPLMQRAQALAAQSSNRRGLLNSSMGVGAGTAAMIDAGLQIATPDAQARVGAAMQNAEQSNRVNMQNAQNSLTAGMFNNDLQAKLGMFDGEMNFKAGAFNAEQVNSVMRQHLDQAGQIKLAEINNQYNKDLQSSAQAANLYSNTLGVLAEIWSSDHPNKQQLQDNVMSYLSDGLALTGGLDKMMQSGELNFMGSSSKKPEDTRQFTSVLTSSPLGTTQANPNTFNTIGGVIPSATADIIKNTFDIDPRFAVTQKQTWTNQDLQAAVTQGIKEGKIFKVPLTQKTGVKPGGMFGGSKDTYAAIDPRLADLGQFLYYDPSNYLNMANSVNV